MRLLRDFKCNDGHITERFIDNQIDTVPCRTCGKDAQKTLGLGTIILDGTDPSFPGAWNKWANVRESRHHQTMARNRSDGK